MYVLVLYFRQYMYIFSFFYTVLFCLYCSIFCPFIYFLAYVLIIAKSNVKKSTPNINKPDSPNAGNISLTTKCCAV